MIFELKPSATSPLLTAARVLVLMQSTNAFLLHPAYIATIATKTYPPLRIPSLEKRLQSQEMHLHILHLTPSSSFSFVEHSPHTVADHDALKSHENCHKCNCSMFCRSVTQFIVDDHISPRCCARCFSTSGHCLVQGSIHLYRIPFSSRRGGQAHRRLKTQVAIQTEGIKGNNWNTDEDVSGF